MTCCGSDSQQVFFQCASQTKRGSAHSQGQFAPATKSNDERTEFRTASQLNYEGSHLRLRIATRPVAGYGFQLWHAARALSWYLEHRETASCDGFGSSLCLGRRVLELGSGPGLVGIVAAHLGADVTLSDMQEALPIARHNVGLNPVPHGSSGKMRVEELCWGQDVRRRFAGDQFDVILGSDVTYDGSLHGLLVATLLQLSSERTEIIFAHQWRPSYPFDLWQLRFRRYFRIEVLATRDEIRSYAASGLELPADTFMSILRLTWVGPPPLQDDLTEIFRRLEGTSGGEMLLERLLLRDEDLDAEDENYVGDEIQCY